MDDDFLATLDSTVKSLLNWEISPIILPHYLSIRNLSLLVSILMKHWGHEKLSQ